METNSNDNRSNNGGNNEGITGNNGNNNNAGPNNNNNNNNNNGNNGHNYNNNNNGNNNNNNGNNNNNNNNNRTRRGRCNYSRDETLAFLDLMERDLPIGQQEWNAINEEHAHNWSLRGVDSLRRKYSELHRKKVPTGDPNIPPEVLAAKRIHYKIGRKAEISTVEEYFDPIQGFVDESQDITNTNNNRNGLNNNNYVNGNNGNNGNNNGNHGNNSNNNANNNNVARINNNGPVDNTNNNGNNNSGDNNHNGNYGHNDNNNRNGNNNNNNGSNNNRSGRAGGRPRVASPVNSSTAMSEYLEVAKAQAQHSMNMQTTWTNIASTLVEGFLEYAKNENKRKHGED